MISDFQIGHVLYHRIFGRGAVMDIAESPSGDGEGIRLQMRFDEVGIKWLVAKYANLQPTPFSTNACPEDDLDAALDTVTESSRRCVLVLTQEEQGGFLPAPAKAIPQVDQPQAMAEAPEMLELRSQRPASRRGLLKVIATFFAAAPAIPALASRTRHPGRRLSVLETRIAGFAYYRGQECLPNIQAGDRLLLSREPGNPHDHKAVEVFWRGRKIGYVPHSHNVALAKLMDGHERVDAQVVRLLDRPREPLEFSVYVVV